jgi:hypothetical protein
MTSIGDGPGLGIDLDKEAIVRFPYKSCDLWH